MNITTRATSRTWAATVTYRECGVIVDRVTYTVTLTRTVQGIQATMNGQPAQLKAALNILQGAQVNVTAETLDTTPAPIGKPRAARLHRLMARAGLPSGEHYRFASAALDRPVFSLAVLTEADARAVWRFLQGTHRRAA